jgi:hypothetical protein
MFIGPVSANRGSTSSMSSFEAGKNLIVIVQLIPADIRPGGGIIISNMSYEIVNHKI